MAAVTEAGQLADMLLAALILELRNDGTDADLCAKSIYPGRLVPIDYGLESCGGMAFVKLDGVVPTSAFPVQDTSPNSCVTTLAYTFELGVMRPAPHIDYQNNEPVLPDDAENDAASYDQYADMMAMRRAVQELRDEVEYVVLGAYTPMGPDGGAVGGVWTVQLGRDL